MNAPRPLPEAGQIAQLTGDLAWAVSCAVCRSTLRGGAPVPVDVFVPNIQMLGWREIEADGWAAKGWRCPECMERPAKPLVMNITLEQGRGDLAIHVRHPLGGAIRKAVASGGPPGEWGFVIVDASAAGDVRRVVGAFAFTPKQRVLFFPAIAMRLCDSETGEQLATVDHVTLEQSSARRFSSHMTVVEKPKKKVTGLGKGSLVAPKGFALPWFSMLVPGLGDFVEAPKRLQIQFLAPRPDLQRFARELAQVHHDCVVPLVDSDGGERFFQIDVWVRWPNQTGTKVQPLPWVSVLEIVTGSPGRQELRFASNTLSFLSGVEVVVVTSRPLGTVGAPAFLQPRSFNPLKAG